MNLSLAPTALSSGRKLGHSEQQREIATYSLAFQGLGLGTEHKCLETYGIYLKIPV